MDQWIRPYIQQKPDPKKATHFYLPTQSYLAIPIDAQRDFWLTYCQAVQEGRNPLLCEYIGSRETTQLGYDINIQFDRQQVPVREDVVDDLMESIDQYIEYIIETIQSLIGSYFQLSQKGIEILAAYIRRDDQTMLVWKDNTIEFVGKIIFPYARIRTDYVQRFYYFLVNQLQISGGSIDEHIAIAPLNGLDTFIRPCSTTNLEMYGSHIDQDHPQPELINLYGRLDNDIKNTYEVSKAFVPMLHSVVSSGIISPEIIEIEGRNRGINFWLPLFFSNGFYDQPMPLREGVILFESEAPQITISVIRDGGEVLTKLELARRLLSYLDTSRAKNYWSWYDIGDALHSIDQGEEGLKLWKWFTNQGDFKTGDDCEEVWYTYNDTKNVDIATLEYFASVDSPQNYQAIREHQIEDALAKALRMQEHTQIARAFKACYPHQFVCSNFKEGTWYYYSDHRWVTQSGTSVLMHYINEVFQPYLETRSAELGVKKGKTRDVKARAEYESDINMYNTLVAKLSKNGFKVGLCQELKTYYHNSNFYQLRDMGKELMACPNGVMDFRGGKPVFRPGKPQDYITKSARCPFPSHFTWESQPVVDLLKYYSQLFRSQIMQSYLRRLTASLMISGNADKIFPMLTGSGNNSKTMFIRLIEKAFGSYCGKLPTSYITGKQGKADDATPALLSTRGCKIVVMQEPDKKEKIRSGPAKAITGNDTAYVRELFQKGADIVEMEVTFVPFLIANKLPAIPDCQEAIWDRTRILELKNVWKNDAPDDEAEQFRTGVFKKDRFFDNKLPKMAPALLWVAFHDYEDYYQNGLGEPAEVVMATESFRVANNIFIHFTRDCVKQVLDEHGAQEQTAFVTLDDLYNSFRRWYADQQFRSKIPNKTEFKEDLEIVWREKADGDNRWYGLQLNSQTSTIANLLTF